MDMQQRLYPVGRQDFAEIRTAGNFMYIDKTEAPRIHAEILFPGQEGAVPGTGY